MRACQILLSHRFGFQHRRQCPVDRAVVYLSKFPPQVALATALSVELSLATSWEEEQREMIRQGDPRVVFRITANDMQNLNDALAEIPPVVQSDAAAEQHVFDLLADFPPDQAWLVAHNVAKWAAIFVRMKNIQVVS